MFTYRYETRPHRLMCLRKEGDCEESDNAECQHEAADAGSEVPHRVRGRLGGDAVVVPDGEPQSRPAASMGETPRLFAMWSALRLFPMVPVTSVISEHPQLEPFKGGSARLELDSLPGPLQATGRGPVGGRSS